MRLEHPVSGPLRVAHAKAEQVADEDGKPEHWGCQHLVGDANVGGVVVANAQLWARERGGSSHGRVGRGLARPVATQRACPPPPPAPPPPRARDCVAMPPRTSQREEGHEWVHQQVGQQREDGEEPRPVARHQRHLQCHRAQQRHKGDLAEAVDVGDAVRATVGERVVGHEEADGAVHDSQQHARLPEGERGQRATAALVVQLQRTRGDERGSGARQQSGLACNVGANSFAPLWRRAACGCCKHASPPLPLARAPAGSG